MSAVIEPSGSRVSHRDVPFLPREVVRSACGAGGRLVTIALSTTLSRGGWGRKGCGGLVARHLCHGRRREAVVGPSENRTVEISFGGRE